MAKLFSSGLPLTPQGLQLKEYLRTINIDENEFEGLPLTDQRKILLDAGIIGGKTVGMDSDHVKMTFNDISEFYTGSNQTNPNPNEPFDTNLNIGGEQQQMSFDESGTPFFEDAIQEPRQLGGGIPADQPEGFSRSEIFAQKEDVDDNFASLQAQVNESPEERLSRVKAQTMDDAGPSNGDIALGTSLLGLGLGQAQEGATAVSGIESIGGLTTAIGGAFALAGNSKLGAGLAVTGTLLNMIGQRKSAAAERDFKVGFANAMGDALRGARSING